jgi:predicted ATPase
VPAPRPEPDPTAAVVTAVPRLLPADISDFTGRAIEVAQLRSALTQPGTEVRLAVVTGAGGVGKTALTVHVAHQVSRHFPDGQLYLNLRGYQTSEPVRPADALGRFLRALGVDSPLPETADERAELYRNLLADRRVLVVLDNAHTADQVRPLIPGTAACAVVVNSRSRLAGALAGTEVTVDGLDESHATKLLTRIAGPERVSAEPQATSALVESCGGLPLALRISAAWLAAKPHWTIKRLAERLADERHRLDQLAFEDLDVRSSIAFSYRGIDADARRLLCRLSDIDLVDIDVCCSAALLGHGPAQAEEILEQLYDARLIDVAGHEPNGYSRYRLHDLVRLFVKERIAADEVPHHG